MPDLKLAQLPDRTPIKFAITILPDLHRKLVDYAEAYEAAYGRKEEIAELVPAMLAAFIEGDREFAKRLKIDRQMSRRNSWPRASTKEHKTLAVPAIEPISVRIPTAVAMTGFSRSRIYELISAGEIKIVKDRRSTLILVASLREAVQKRQVDADLSEE